MALLERLSDLLRWQKQDPSFHLPWKQNSLPILSDSSPLYHTLTKPDPLTPQEEEDLRLTHDRLTKLCQRCVELNVPLTVDAEDTNIQPGIDYLTYNSAIEFNKLGEIPVVYGTIQAYLKDAKERLLLATNAADKMGLPLGFKLVRGAYMSSESKLANSLGFDSPIHNTIQDTHKCYNDCASFMLDKIVDKSGAVVLATHNVDSGVFQLFQELRLVTITSKYFLCSIELFKKHKQFNETEEVLDKNIVKYIFFRVMSFVSLDTYYVSTIWYIGKLAASKARDLGIGKENDRLQFAQLYGMSEALSYGLANAGFQVSKYLTFGPVEEVIPYLLRRAEENRGMLSSSSLDRQLMGMELKRRVKERCGM